MSDQLRRKTVSRLGGWMEPLPFFEAVASELSKSVVVDGDLERCLLGPDFNNKQRFDKAELLFACSVRNVQRCRRLACLLIDDDGAFDEELLDRALYLVRRYTHSAARGFDDDGVRQQHLLDCLSRLNKDQELRDAVLRISAPHNLAPAEAVIRETLLLDASETLNDAHARRAALSAWFTYLRQNVGSCFATAPAIVVHTEQPGLFFQDLEALLGTGRLTRVVAGRSLTVPFTTSWGIGDLRRQVWLDRSPDRCPLPIWQSPGLQQAFLEAGLLVETEGLETQLKKKLFEYLDELADDKLPAPFAVDALMESLLRAQHSITDEDLQSHERQVPQLLIGTVLAPMPNRSDLESRMAAYHEALSKAKNAFRGMTDNALLKAWEFSLASFAETKVQFARWNLYASLGFNHTEPGGIGERLYQVIQERLNDLNQQIETYNDQLEMMQLQVEYTGQRLQRAASDQEARRIQTEYQARSAEMRHVQTSQQLVHRKAEILSRLHGGLLGELDDEFQEFFQEVYDPDMHEVQSGPYDDAPAGFRLLCKYGRSSTTQWTMIHTPGDFAEALAAFFVHAEHVLLNREDLEPVRDELAPIITGLVAHVKTTQFLESAFERMAKAHGGRLVKNPLENLSRVDKKPWSYTSGGDMSALVANYFARDRKPSERARWVENPTELLAFLIDSVRELPSRTQDLFNRHKQRRLLMHSPTHAFTFLPGLAPFKDAWYENDSYTYTWIRDNWVEPAREFLGHFRLEEQAVDSILKQLRQGIPEHFQQAFDDVYRVVPNRITPPELRVHLLQAARKERTLRWGASSIISAEAIDSILYKQLPFTSGDALKRNLERLFSVLPDQSEAKLAGLMECYEAYRDDLRKPTLLSSEGLREIALGIVLSYQGSLHSATDWHREVGLAASRVGLAMPIPIVFADSNWVTDFFAFVMNPGTLELEFWRVNSTGTKGAPMTMWTEWLDGSRHDREWAVLNEPSDFIFVPRETGHTLRA